MSGYVVMSACAYRLTVPLAVTNPKRVVAPGSGTKILISYLENTAGSGV